MSVFAIRHSETEWSLSGRHTSTTDILLTGNGRRVERMRPVLADEAFALILVSPMRRARETCELAGLGEKAVVDPDLHEWNYGEYEGLTPQQINKMAPGWLIFRDGCPGVETPEQVGARVDRVIARTRAIEGDAVLFAHGHVLRAFAARWLGLPAGAGWHFLDTCTVSVLSYYRGTPAVRLWNRPVVAEPRFIDTHESVQKLVFRGDLHNWKGAAGGSRQAGSWRRKGAPPTPALSGAAGGPPQPRRDRAPSTRRRPPGGP